MMCLVDFEFKENCSASATSDVERPLQNKSQPHTKLVRAIIPAHLGSRYISTYAEISTSAESAEVS